MRNEKKPEVCKGCLCLHSVAEASLCKDRDLSAGLRRGSDYQRNWERGSPAEAGKRSGRNWKGQEKQDEAREGGEVWGRTSKRIASQSKALHETLVVCHHVQGFLRLTMTP